MMNKRVLNASIKLLWKPYPYFFASGLMTAKQTVSKK